MSAASQSMINERDPSTAALALSASRESSCVAISTSSGKFGITVKNRFLIEAEGSAASIDELKAAVSAVDQGTLAGLAG